MINLALLKLHGVTSGATQIIETAIAAGVFADPSTATGENEAEQLLFATRYEPTLQKALTDIRPKFARQFADLGTNIRLTINDSTAYERADWDYIFELPSDYLYPAQIATVHQWSHIVKGDDDQSYYCDTAHVSVDDANDGKPLANDGNGNWTLFNTDDAYGADWEASRSYRRNSTGHLLLSNDYTNVDGDSAYIEYIGYVQAGFADDPNYYDPDFIEAFTTLLAAEMAPWSADRSARMGLMEEYHRLVKPDAIAAQARSDYIEEGTSWLDARNG
jgi:hypothetical protein